MTLIPERNTVPLVVMAEDGSWCVLTIPQMSEQAFDFLLKLLDTYKPAIVRKSETPAVGRAIGSEGASPGDVPDCRTDPGGVKPPASG